MTDGYTPAKIAYRELRSAIGPWAKTNGYARWTGTQAGWRSPWKLSNSFCSSSRAPALRVPTLAIRTTASFSLSPWVARGPRSCASRISRAASFRPSLDELGRIQGAINRRRPPLPSYLKKDIAQDSLLGHSLRALYDPAPQYREGHMISLGYHGLRDVRELAAFIAGACCHKHSNGSCKDASPNRLTTHRRTCGRNGSPR